ncbi:MAG TPA: phage virion morphogenesis protein [Sphingopyxis sp.]|nr:phage virion morphogenesis protein [Sphingopyxis sp.]
MAGVDSGFAELEDFVGSMLLSLEGAQQKKLLGQISQTMRRSHQRRIASQTNPDGSKFAKRKPPKADRQQASHAKKFLYPAGGFGPPRLVVMKSWKKMGDDKFIGFDRRAGGMRTFVRSKIIKNLPSDAGGSEGGGGDGGRGKGRSIRRGAMFRKIRTGRYLRAGQAPDEAWIGFVGLLGQIASVHQYGLKDKPGPFAEAVDYPQRELLGLSEKDRDDLMDAVIEHLMA